MSAETLRQAAELMRERAEAASEYATPPWHQYGMAGVSSAGGPEPVGEYPVECGGCDDRVGLTGCLDMATAAHIASWHPAVALAVADWLESEANEWGDLPHMLNPHALAVARVYLGEFPNPEEQP